MTDAPVDPIRLKIADRLDAIAEAQGWDQELWKQFDDFLKQTKIDSFLSLADEELIHYSGVFSAYNLLGMKKRPDTSQIKKYRDTFRGIAAALRNGTTWEEYERAKSCEKGDLASWIKGLFSK